MEIRNDDAVVVYDVLCRAYMTSDNKYVPINHLAWSQSIRLANAIREVERLYGMDSVVRPLRPIADEALAPLKAALVNRLDMLGVSAEWIFGTDATDGGLRVTAPGLRD